MSTLSIIMAVGFPIGIFMFFGWGIMAAAKRGDQFLEDCEFNRDWADPVEHHDFRRMVKGVHK